MDSLIFSAKILIFFHPASYFQFELLIVSQCQGFATRMSSLVVSISIFHESMAKSDHDSSPAIN